MISYREQERIGILKAHQTLQTNHRHISYLEAGSSSLLCPSDISPKNQKAIFGGEMHIVGMNNQG